MDEINEYLVRIGFTKNDWGFLSHTIEGIAYTLIDDPLSGFALQYSYIKARSAGNSLIPLGKEPSLIDIENAFKKILS